MLILRHIYKNKVIKTYRFTGGEANGLISVGSSRQALIRLMGDGVNPQHAVFEKHASGGWTVMDLNFQPGTRVDGNAIVEAALVHRCNISVGEHVLEFMPAKRIRPAFDGHQNPPQKIDFTTDAGKQLVILKHKGRVIESKVLAQSKALRIGSDLGSDFIIGLSPQIIPSSDLSQGALVTRVGDYELVRTQVASRETIVREKITLDREMRKPLGISALTVLLFLLCFLGWPAPKEDKKPENNVYTRMIFDGKILKQKREKLQAQHKIASTSGTANNSPSKSAQAQASSPAITKLRASGLQSIIGKIAMRASKSTRILVGLGSMPSAEASVPTSHIGQVPSLGTSGGPGKSFSIKGVTTNGKGGGNKSYKSDAGLGSGSIGQGEVGIDEEETNVEGGLDREVIASVIREHLGQVRYCYERQLAGNPDLIGKIKVRFGIAADGQVFTQNIGQSTIKNAMLEECILRRVAKWKFPKPKGGTQVMVSYPFLFKSVN